MTYTCPKCSGNHLLKNCIYDNNINENYRRRGRDDYHRKRYAQEFVLRPSQLAQDKSFMMYYLSDEELNKLPDNKPESFHTSKNNFWNDD